MNRKPVFIEAAAVLEVGVLLDDLKKKKPPVSIDRVSRSTLVKLYVKQIEGLINRGYSIKSIAEYLSKATSTEITGQLIRQQVRIRKAKPARNEGENNRDGDVKSDSTASNESVHHHVRSDERML